ncbi:MAG: hypothetical protein CL819_01335 [Croceicoccus sp.]|nr:hypothetical protein [Croceicoccus sp.]
MHINPDGTLIPQDEISAGQQALYPQQVPVNQKSYVDDFTALQLGLWMILDGLVFTTIDRLALVTENSVESNTFKFTRIFLDWPDSEDGSVPIPSATIYAPTETDLQLPGPMSGQQLLEDTVDVFAEGTALKGLYSLAADLVVTMWLAEKDERAAVRKGLVEAFHEPGDERSGRRVVVPWYFDRVARFDLRGITYDDSAEQARGKTFPLSARFSADIEAVALVQLPTTILPPRFDVHT